MPACAAFGFMDAKLTEEDAEREREQQKMYMEYLIAVNARTPQSKDEAKVQQKFADQLKPKELTKAKGPAKVYKWDPDLMERLKQKQNK